MSVGGRELQAAPARFSEAARRVAVGLASKELQQLQQPLSQPSQSQERRPYTPSQDGSGLVSREADGVGGMESATPHPRRYPQPSPIRSVPRPSSTASGVRSSVTPAAAALSPPSPQPSSGKSRTRNGGSQAPATSPCNSSSTPPSKSPRSRPPRPATALGSSASPLCGLSSTGSTPLGLSSMGSTPLGLSSTLQVPRVLVAVRGKRGEKEDRGKEGFGLHLLG